MCPEGNMQTAAIIPVWLSSTTQPTKEVLVYALLDSQSDTTFVLNEIAESLDTTKESVKLELSTMTSKRLLNRKDSKNYKYVASTQTKESVYHQLLHESLSQQTKITFQQMKQQRLGHILNISKQKLLLCRTVL